VACSTSGGAPISWFQFARTIFEVAGLKPMLLATHEREYLHASEAAEVFGALERQDGTFGLAPHAAGAPGAGGYFEERIRAVSGIPA